jgi:hypothetical protein
MSSGREVGGNSDIHIGANIISIKTPLRNWSASDSAAKVVYFEALKSS